MEQLICHLTRASRFEVRNIAPEFALARNLFVQWDSRRNAVVLAALSHWAKVNNATRPPSHEVTVREALALTKLPMKTHFTRRFLVGLALAITPFINGCTQQSAGTSPPYITTSAPPSVVTQIVPTSPTSAPAPANLETAETITTVPPLILSNAPAIVVAEPVLPANLRISRPLNEILQLVQSGVAETVILTYVTNSQATFALGAEEIVYLSDLGVGSSVIMAMMQHDLVLKSTWASGAAAPIPTNEEPVATAPTYVNPPQAAPLPENQPVYVSNNYFNETLSPYGSWVEVEGYGRCWRPTVAVNSNWQPYRDRGRWVYTDAGWYWMSDYSWGSVAFHYGRWFSHSRLGWVWWPDTVWAPSWVTWRYDNDYYGWAPLPPNSIYRPGIGFSYYGRSVGSSFDFDVGVGAYTFVPWKRFNDPHPYRHSLGRPRSIAIYNQTTVINNVGTGRNNSVINRGIPADHVREKTRAEVRTVAIREETSRHAGPRAERFERDGRTLVVNRPATLPQGGGQSSFAPSGKTTTRITPPKAPEPVVINSSSTITEGRPANADRKERQENRTPRSNDNRGIGRMVVPAHATPSAPAVVTAPVKPIAPPAATPPTVPPQTEPRKLENAVKLNRPNSATVVRIPENKTPANPAVPARAPTPIFSKPVIVERPAYTPSRSMSPPAPAPNANPDHNWGNQNSGREKSIWSPPASQTQPTARTPAPNYRNAPERSRNNQISDSTPHIQNNPPPVSAPNYNRPNVETRREERANRNNMIERSAPSRPVERNPAVIYSAPVINTPAPAPRPSYSPPVPAPAAPRIESRPAPTPAPARAEQPRAETKSNPDRNQRNR